MANAEKYEYDVCVIGGAGHVGLPLSIAFADKGLKVVIQDINESVFALIESGKMPFLDKGAEPVLARVINKTLFATTDPATAGKAKAVIVVIGTPVDGHLNPELRTLTRLCEEVGPNLRGDQVVILRSTLYPGTTERLRGILKKFNPAVEVCFCPERIAQGKALEELHSLPQIVSGFEPWRWSRRRRSSASSPRISSPWLPWKPNSPSSSRIPIVTSSSRSRTSSI